MENEEITEIVDEISETESTNVEEVSENETDEDINDLVEEIKKEQQIPSFFDDEILINYVKEAKYNINTSSGAEIDYDTDLDARSLLKNYVLYANHKRLAEFKQLYCGEYAKLQAKYYANS